MAKLQSEGDLDAILSVVDLISELDAPNDLEKVGINWWIKFEVKMEECWPISSI